MSKLKELCAARAAASERGDLVQAALSLVGVTVFGIIVAGGAIVGQAGNEYRYATNDLREAVAETVDDINVELYGGDDVVDVTNNLLRDALAEPALPDGLDVSAQKVGVDAWMVRGTYTVEGQVVYTYQYNSDAGGTFTEGPRH